MVLKFGLVFGWGGLCCGDSVGYWIQSLDVSEGLSPLTPTLHFILYMIATSSDIIFSLNRSVLSSVINYSVDYK